MKRLKALSLVLVVALLFFSLSGCAGTVSAIKHASLETKVKMSESILLSPLSLAKSKVFYVKMTNTSELQGVQVEPMLRDLLVRKGKVITDDPEKADYILMGQVIYFDLAKTSDMTADAMALGGTVGAIAGSSIGSGWKGNTLGAIGAGAAVSILGGIAGSLVHVDRFIGAVDLQVQERVPGGVKGTMRTSASMGNSTNLVTERAVDSDYQIYRTRIAAEATQTNIDKEEAARVISGKLAIQIAGLF